jgi:hypothetical protein
MTTYIIGKEDGDFVLDRSKLSFPCKVVDLRDETETYYWSESDQEGVEVSAPEPLGRTVDINEIIDNVSEDEVIGFVPNSDGETLDIVFGQWDSDGTTVDGENFPGFSGWNMFGSMMKRGNWPAEKHAIAYVDEDGFLVPVFVRDFTAESSATFDTIQIDATTSGLIEAIVYLCGKIEKNSAIGFSEGHLGYLAVSFEHSDDNAGEITIVGNKLPDSRRSPGVTVLAVRQLGTVVTPGNEDISVTGIDWHDIAVDGYGNVTLTLSSLAD